MAFHGGAIARSNRALACKQPHVTVPRLGLCTTSSIRRHCINTLSILQRLRLDQDTPILTQLRLPKQLRALTNPHNSCRCTVSVRFSCCPSGLPAALCSPPQLLTDARPAPFAIGTTKISCYPRPHHHRHHPRAAPPSSLATVAHDDPAAARTNLHTHAARLMR